MDVRYNVIQWVHRLTRGAGATATGITDPRTGEIIKGQVLLGSLRVRQDLLIAEGLPGAVRAGRRGPDRRQGHGPGPDPPARRPRGGPHAGPPAQLHLEQPRDGSSVMDYPHPLVTLSKPTGAWTCPMPTPPASGPGTARRSSGAIPDFPAGTDEPAALDGLIRRGPGPGPHLPDRPGRPALRQRPSPRPISGTTAPAPPPSSTGSWASAGPRSASSASAAIPTGLPLATLEDALVPLYLFHRYQVEAATKVIGGQYYDLRAPR